MPERPVTSEIPDLPSSQPEEIPDRPPSANMERRRLPEANSVPETIPSPTANALPSSEPSLPYLPIIGITSGFIILAFVANRIIKRIRGKPVVNSKEETEVDLEKGIG